jgi:hypothetical protein
VPADSCPLTLGQRRQHHGTDAYRRRPDLLSIAGGAPRPTDLLEPATPVPRLQGCAVAQPSGRPLSNGERGRGSSAAGSAGGDAAGLAIDSMGRAAADGSPLRCARSALINGGGSAAAHINQWKRLRRGEYQMGTGWAIPAWANGVQVSTVLSTVSQPWARGGTTTDH